MSDVNEAENFYLLVTYSIVKKVNLSAVISVQLIKELLATQPEQEGAPQRVCPSQSQFARPSNETYMVIVLALTAIAMDSIKKPKTHRYPSLNGTDPKFRRNHRHALHGTMKALKEVKEGKRDAA
ncbi:60S ribosomal protein L29 [Xylographa trunciseda]|nr:60S ribosomal protein L29 [Xylographa trunciseda]